MNAFQVIRIACSIVLMVGMTAMSVSAQESSDALAASNARMEESRLRREMQLSEDTMTPATRDAWNRYQQNTYDASTAEGKKAKDQDFMRLQQEWRSTQAEAHKGNISTEDNSRFLNEKGAAQQERATPAGRENDLHTFGQTPSGNKKPYSDDDILATAAHRTDGSSAEKGEISAEQIRGTRESMDQRFDDDARAVGLEPKGNSSRDTRTDVMGISTDPALHQGQLDVLKPDAVMYEDERAAKQELENRTFDDQGNRVGDSASAEQKAAYLQEQVRQQRSHAAEATENIEQGNRLLQENPVEGSPGRQEGLRRLQEAQGEGSDMISKYGVRANQTNDQVHADAPSQGTRVQPSDQIRSAQNTLTETRDISNTQQSADLVATNENNIKNQQLDAALGHARSGNMREAAEVSRNADANTRGEIIETVRNTTRQEHEQGLIDHMSPEDVARYEPEIKNRAREVGDQAAKDLAGEMRANPNRDTLDTDGRRWELNGQSGQNEDGSLVSETQQVRNAGITETLGTARADAAGPQTATAQNSGDGGPVSSITGRGDLSVRNTGSANLDLNTRGIDSVPLRPTQPARPSDIEAAGTVLGVAGTGMQVYSAASNASAALEADRKAEEAQGKRDDALARADLINPESETGLRDTAALLGEANRQGENQLRAAQEGHVATRNAVESTVSGAAAVVELGHNARTAQQAAQAANAARGAQSASGGLGGLGRAAGFVGVGVDAGQGVRAQLEANDKAERAENARAHAERLRAAGQHAAADKFERMGAGLEEDSLVQQEGAYDALGRVGVGLGAMAVGALSAPAGAVAGGSSFVYSNVRPVIEKSETGQQIREQQNDAMIDNREWLPGWVQALIPEDPRTAEATANIPGVVIRSELQDRVNRGELELNPNSSWEDVQNSIDGGKTGLIGAHFGTPDASGVVDGNVDTEGRSRLDDLRAAEGSGVSVPFALGNGEFPSGIPGVSVVSLVDTQAPNNWSNGPAGGSRVMDERARAAEFDHAQQAAEIDQQGAELGQAIDSSRTQHEAGMRETEARRAQRAEFGNAIGGAIAAGAAQGAAQFGGAVGRAAGQQAVGYDPHSEGCSGCGGSGGDGHADGSSGTNTGATTTGTTPVPVGSNTPECQRLTKLQQDLMANIPAVKSGDKAAIARHAQYGQQQVGLLNACMASLSPDARDVLEQAAGGSIPQAAPVNNGGSTNVASSGANCSALASTLSGAQAHLARMMKYGSPSDKANKKPGVEREISDAKAAMSRAGC